MGESVVEAPNLENKKGESISSGASLEVSVSFGRFENDSLSWEKWSTFSPNKYLEEVGKCSTPGSVAQKKAYFEAHYKKIAARKAEEIENEKQMENNDEDDHIKLGIANESSTDTDEQVCGHSEESNEIATAISESQRSPLERSEEENDYSLHSHLEEEKLEESTSAQDGTHTGKSRPENVELPPVLVQEDNHVNESREEKVEMTLVLIQGDSHLEKVELPPVLVQEDNLINESHEERVETTPVLIHGDSHLEPSVSVQEDNLINESHEERVETTPVLIQEDSHLEKVELPSVLVREDNPINESHEEKVEMIPVLIQGDSHLDGSTKKVEPTMNFEKDTSQSPNNKKANLDASSKVQKINPSKERSLGAAKKKPASPLPRISPAFSTPKTSKPALVSASVSSSRSSTKKANDLSSLMSKTNSTGVGKKVAPSALHTSLNFDPANSEATPLTTTRKSLIMESMGDKDIVKRAFKQFQNSFNQTRDHGDERSTGQKASTTKAGQNLSTSLTPSKENQGVKKMAEKMDAQRAQLGRSWNTTSVRSLRGPAMDKKSAKPAPSSSGLRSDERAEKRKEAVKKLEEKPRTKGAEKTRLTSKSKEEKETDSRKLMRSQNSKASPLPGSGHGPVVKKSPLEKGGVKSERLHRPEMHR